MFLHLIWKIENFCIFNDSKWKQLKISLLFQFLLKIWLNTQRHFFTLFWCYNNGMASQLNFIFFCFLVNSIFLVCKNCQSCQKLNNRIEKIIMIEIFTLTFLWKKFQFVKFSIPLLTHANDKTQQKYFNNCHHLIRKMK